MNNYKKLSDIFPVHQAQAKDLQDSQADVTEKTYTRLYTHDGYPAHFKNIYIGKVVKVKLSSMCIGQVVNPQNNQAEQKATIDIVDENGKAIDWEFIEVLT
jgi:hypothetical protein